MSEITNGPSGLRSTSCLDRLIDAINGGRPRDVAATATKTDVVARSVTYAGVLDHYMVDGEFNVVGVPGQTVLVCGSAEPCEPTGEVTPR